VLPPSTLIAGMICQTDRSFGVWHAPANIALKEVVEPCVSIDNGEQEWLNVDLITGKSVNAIRKFIGKPPLLWGARTLNGNHDEWRYISVRRLFNQVEAHLKEITQF
jgi:phage tail sheath protein FI